MNNTDRVMMAWLFAVFQYKNEGILNEARDLKKRREMVLWQWVAILWNFLPKGCCVHKNTMWIQSKIRQVLRRGICWGLPNRQTTPGFGNSSGWKELEDGTILWGKYPIFLILCLLFRRHPLANIVPWFCLFKSASAHWWWNLTDFLTHFS